ncbi:hypothetical protein CMV_022555 [Castanea mollissima]|uniref:Reverse transcriptase zinc-binding domain-containing protein n=1 Tax=Castanea mollissima TaxID=60419 RepID=A0A8J4V7X0_9ROSI|nr:hypothetical protein CMV_022555 [Castanea mollissima]
MSPNPNPPSKSGPTSPPLNSLLQTKAQVENHSSSSNIKPNSSIKRKSTNSNPSDLCAKKPKLPQSSLPPNLESPLAAFSNDVESSRTAQPSNFECALSSFINNDGSSRRSLVSQKYGEAGKVMGKARQKAKTSLKALARIKNVQEPVGKSGGLAIFWKAGVDLEIVYSDRNVIASLVYYDLPSSPWLFLLIYGPPHANGRARFWKCLEDMVSAFAGPCFSLGRSVASDKSGFIPTPRSQVGNSCLVVSQLLNPSGSGWNDNLLNELFDQESIVAIKNIPIWSFGQEDRWTWTKSENGQFSMKSCYCLITDGDNMSSSVSLTRKIWKANIHERLKMHLWRIAFNLLPTKVQLSEFSPSSDTSCPLCNVEVESALHLFTQCHIARAIWFGSQWNLRIDRWHVQSPAYLIELFCDPPPFLQLDKEQRDEFLLFGALTLDMIWKWRNKAIHESSFPVKGLVLRSLQKLFLEHWQPKVPVLSGVPTRSSAKWCCPSQESDCKVCIDAIKAGGNYIP